MRKSILNFLLVISIVSSCGGGDIVVDVPSKPTYPTDKEGETTTPTTAPTEKPELDGVLVYHNYKVYGDGTSKIYTYDFKTKEFKCISEKWGAYIKDPMNAMFSPDGKEIVFMGVRLDGTTSTGRDSWCLFHYTLGSSEFPKVLIATPDRDEDPKYSADGKKVVFKRTAAGTANIWELDMETLKATQLTNVASGIQCSMPYYSADGKYIVVSTRPAGSSSGRIDRIDVNTKNIITLYQKTGVEAYYPIGIDNESFYYSIGYSATMPYDQIYKGYYSGAQSVRLPLNKSNVNSSDACPVNDEWLIISSSDPSGKGGYDLWICSTAYAVGFPMTQYNSDINTSAQELGAMFHLRK